MKFKTTLTRHIRSFMSAEYLKIWKADYPGTPDGSALVFVNEKGQPFLYATVAKRIQRVVQRAGITKHVTPHLFRHSRITQMIKDGVSESVIKMMMWGSVNTTMFKTYAHLTGKDIDSELARVYGIEKTEEPKKPQVAPQQCPHCKHINPPTTTWCYGCGESMDPKSAATDEQMKRFIIQHGKELSEFIANLNKNSELLQIR